MGLYSGEVAIKNGDMYVYKDNKTARLWYTTALQDMEYKNIALRKLIELERKTGNYKMARDYVNMLLEYKDVEANYFLARIEHTECNYIKALESYSKSFSTGSQLVNLRFIANVYTQLGEFEIARRMYETLVYNSSSKNIALLEIINLDIFEGDYNHGLKLCNQVKSSFKQDEEMLNNLYLTLMYNLGRLNEVDLSKFGNLYTYKRLISCDNVKLISHISKHNKVDNLIELIFSSEDIINTIVSDMYNVFNSVNPVYSKGGLLYKFETNYKIGEYYGLPIKAVCVVTTKDNIILTMYPIYLSSEFDREGMTHSEDLKKKRLMGVRK